MPLRIGTSLRSACTDRMARANNHLPNCPIAALQQIKQIESRRSIQLKRFLLKPTCLANVSRRGRSQVLCKAASSRTALTMFGYACFLHVWLVYCAIRRLLHTFGCRYGQDFDSRYELKDKIGAGGFGTVYKVVSKLTGQECAHISRSLCFAQYTLALSLLQRVLCF